MLNYGSHTGQFDTIHVTGLAAGLVVTPEYNGTNMTLVVSASAGSLALGRAASSSSMDQTPFIAAGLEQLVAENSEARSILATTRSSESFIQPTVFRTVFESENSNRADDPSSDEFWINDDASAAASDEVFESLGDKLLFASI